MEFMDPNSSHHQPPPPPHPPQLYESQATHNLSLHQPTPAPPHSSASSSFPYYTNPNPNPNPYPSSEISLPIPPQSYSGQTADYYYQHPPPPQQQPQYGVDSFTYGAIGTGNPAADLETKRLKVVAGGAPPDSVRICTICNVVCNSDKVFAFHLAGEKHALKAFGIASNPLKSKTPAYMKTLHSTNKATHPTQKRAPKLAAKQASKGLVTFVQSSYCQVCKIDCQSQEVLSSHKLGKKHIKNLQKLQESITPKPANAPAKLVTTSTSSNQSNAVNEQLQPNAGPAAKEDLEMKKQKVLSGGAAADAVRVCAYCNVVCNSELVYKFHIAGKKHAAMVRKQQQQAAPAS